MNKLTPKQESFAKKYIELGNASEAYRQSYNAEKMKAESITVNASQLLSSTNVALRVKELQAIHTKKHMFTVDKAHKQYIAAYDMAEDKEKPETMISATRAQCDLHGIEAPKKINLEGSLGEWLSSLQGSKA